MVLHPLEFSECFLDSPWFRENIQQYEEELESTNSQIKHLIKDAKNMLSACKNQGRMMNIFNERLQNFQFDCSENLTDDEKGIAGSLKEFGLMLEEVAGEWFHTIDRAELQLIEPLEKFRKDHINSYRESKKSFEKATERYYKQLEHNLGLSHKKKEQLLQDSDNEIALLRKNFHRESLKYVYKLQEIQERKKFEFVENLLMFIQVYFNYFHQTHETALDCKDYMKDLQMRLVATRERYDGTKDKTQALMWKMADQHDLQVNSDLASMGRWSRAGYLFLMEKNPISARLTSKWTKYFCMYTKENKLFQMVAPYSYSSSSSAGNKGPSIHQSGGVSSGFQEPMLVKTCTRRITDSIDKRFCFDLELEDMATDKQLSFTLQAVSDADRKRWMAVMDGKEPDYIKAKVFTKKKEDLFQLNETGFECVRNLIKEIEGRGVDQEGIYRLVGVTSKVDLLLQKALNPATASTVDYSNTDEWELKTLTSALKRYFRHLPEPLMTFDLHREFIDAAKCEFLDDRVSKVEALMKKLPEDNKKILSILAEHLEKVKEKYEENKMNIQNIGVCFGPTLLRDKEESVQAILDIKFCNIIVEILIEERNVIFGQQRPGQNVKRRSRDLSPKQTGNAISGARLPSQRLKQRPRAVYDPLYEITSTPGRLDEDEASSKPSHAHFSRSAFRHRSPSPKMQTTPEAGTVPSRVSSSDDDDYVFGRKTCIDVNIDRKDVPIPTQSNPRYTDVGVSSAEKLSSDRVDKEIWTPDTAAKSPTAKPRVFARRRATDDHLDAKSPDGQTSPPPLNKFQSSPRINFQLTRKVDPEVHKPGPAGDGTMYTSVNKSKQFNRNKNNSVSGKSHSREKPAKPKHPPPVTTSINQRKKMIATSMREGFSATNALAVLSSAESNSKSTAQSESFVTGCDKSTRVGRRPKSEFIPAAFLVEETSHDNDNKSRFNPQAQKFLKIKVVKPVIVGNEPIGSMPRASAIISSRTPVSSANKPVVLNNNNNNSNSAGITHKEARTLYACEAEDESELSFQAGQLIRDVRKSEEPGWLLGTLNGKTGLVPKNYLEFI